MKKIARQTARVAWLIIGIVALAIGGLGAVLPLLPTTPFVLIAAIAFAKSSARLHAWLLDHSIFGAVINDWRRHGAISRSTKITSIAVMAIVLAISLLLDAPKTVIALQAVVLGACAIFVASRPLPPDQQ
ncbi:MAG: YbaN family protein [Rhodospirillaceae bacterium]|nr:YbaN family protein [Rhodospirillaceae bacterium]